MDINFGCTQCGHCCHDLKLPLSVNEAKAWLGRGGELQILCEAIPWPSEPLADDGPAAYKRQRSFAVRSGALPARVIVTLAATFQGPCPHLRSAMQCAIYDERPRVCRIYPAEINPFTPLRPANKGCPGDAWDGRQPPLMRGGVLVDELTRAQIAEAMKDSVRDVAQKARLCTALGIHTAAMANEGFVVHAPARASLAEALKQVSLAPLSAWQDRQPWQFVSPHAATLAAFAETGADAVAPSVAQGAYLDLQAKA